MLRVRARWCMVIGSLAALLWHASSVTGAHALAFPQSVPDAVQTVVFQPQEGWTGAVPTAADAATIDITWARAEPARGVFAWSVYDREMAQIIAQGKRAVLLLWYLQKGGGASIASQAAPAYVWKDAPSFYDAAGGSLVPDYYSATFLADWSAYVAALAQHFAGTPIAYVRGLTGKGGETTPCLGQGFSADSVCAAHLAAWGPSHNVNRDWMGWLTERTAQEAAAFAPARVVAPVDAWDSGARDPACVLPGVYTCQYHNEWVYRQALTGRFIPGSNALPNDTGHAWELFAAIRAAVPTVRTEFQEQSAATSSAASVNEARAAWCAGGAGADIEWYPRVFTLGYTGPSLFASWQRGTITPPRC